MKSPTNVRYIAESALLSYVYFNPLFRASRMVRRRLRRGLGRMKLTPGIKTA